jgi:putative DNA methylase
VGSLLRRIDWKNINRSTRKQVRNREVFCPPISVFRWWARRPNALVGSLLEASGLKPGELVSDPFSGGGTVAIEAVRRGFRVYAQDLNPWATWGLSTVFDGTGREQLEPVARAFLERLRAIADRAYSSRCAIHGPCEVLHSFWVRTCLCQRCRRPIYLFPYSMLTLASRSTNEQRAVYGCSRCGRVTQMSQSCRVKRCSHCKQRLRQQNEALLPGRAVSCPHCKAAVSYDTAWSKRPRWRAVLIQRRCVMGSRTVVHFDSPTRDEWRQKRYCRPLPRVLTSEIPPGVETNVLLRMGFRRWCDLYPPRQLNVLIEAARLARHLKVEKNIRNRIQIAIVGAAEMAGYLCRWDRFHPKAFEALANHRFSSTGLAVEVNLIGTYGRGTIRRRLTSSIKAAHWLAGQCGFAQGNKTTGRRRCPPGSEARRGHQITIANGDSKLQLLPNGAVKLVLTDPPYFGALQYGELSSIYLVWAQVVKPRRGGWRCAFHREALPNIVRGAGADHYRESLRDIFRETARTLAPDGRLLLTYHSTDFRAWLALGMALHDAGLRIYSLGVANSENKWTMPNGIATPSPETIPWPWLLKTLEGGEKFTVLQPPLFEERTEG